MKSKKLTLRELQKMEKGEIPITEEGQRRLSEMKEVSTTLRTSITAAQNAMAAMPKLSSVSIPQVLPGELTTIVGSKSFTTGLQASREALAAVTSSWGSQIKQFKESMRPFIEQMAKAFEIVQIVDNTAKEVYENERGFYEERTKLKIRNYDTFWYWLCDELDRSIFEDRERNIAVDYEAIVDYYSTFIGQQIARRESNVEAAKNVKNTTSIGSENKNGRITQPSLALFYYYCHEQKCLPPFVAGQMEQSYREAVKPYGLAWKPFQQLYNRFSRSRKDRLAIENRKSLKAAIQLLKDYPDALEMAKDELNTAETRNPIT